MFLPPASLRPRIAPTEPCTVRLAVRRADMTMLRGVVHDPTARRMGGVAGHAGLFSTAADLSIFCRMLLDGGSVQGRAHPLAADGREDDDAGDAAGRAERARPRLGHRLVVLVEPRRAAAARLVRPHGLHRHVALDRSGDARCSSCSCRTACIPDGKGDVTPLRAQVATIVGVGDHRRAVGGGARAADDRPRLRRRRRRAGARAGGRAGADRARRAARRQASRRSRASASAWSPITPAARATARRRSICSSPRRT